MRLGLITFLSVFISSLAVAQIQQNDFPTEWTLYTTFDSVQVEYMTKECNSGNVKNQVLVLFRYTNTSSNEKNMTWSVKEWRNGDCTNCYDIGSHEYERQIILTPGEVLFGDGTTKEDRNVYIFSSFINLIKGMRDTKLTAFEFVNVNVVEN